MLSRGTPQIKYWWHEGDLLTEMDTAMRFFGANDICQSLAQVLGELRSGCNAAWSPGELTLRKMTQSSENIFIPEATLSGTLSTNNRNNVEHITIPCRTRDRTRDQLEDEPLTTTRFLRFVRKLRSQVCAFLRKP